MAKRRGNGEGSIYQRKDGRWCGAISVEGRRKEVYAPTRKEVQAKLEVLKSAIASGLRMDKDRQTVADVLYFWLREVAEPAVRPSTLNTYEVHVRRHLVPTIGKIAISKLTAQHIIRMQNTLLRSGISPRTVRYSRLILSMMLKHAVTWGLVIRNVASDVTAPQVEAAEHYTPTAEDVRMLFEAAESVQELAFVQTAALLGLRSCELRALRWQDMDLNRGQVEIRFALGLQPCGVPDFQPLKTKASRRLLPLPEPLIRTLRAHRAEQLRERMEHADRWQDYDLVFCGEDGLSISAHVAIKVFRHVYTRAGLPHMRLHDLRHACASLLAEQGTPIRATMEIMGHSNIHVTQQVYTHTYANSKREAVSALANLIERVS